MEDRTFILDCNSDEIRHKIAKAGIHVCQCATFEGADWLEYPTSVANGVHGNGYAFEGMTREETRALFLYETKNPVWCSDVDKFIRLIKEFEDGKKK